MTFTRREAFRGLVGQAMSGAAASRGGVAPGPQSARKGDFSDFPERIVVPPVPTMTRGRLRALSWEQRDRNRRSRWVNAASRGLTQQPGANGPGRGHTPPGLMTV